MRSWERRGRAEVSSPVEGGAGPLALKSERYGSPFHP
jgi:hypothetical protein